MPAYEVVDLDQPEGERPDGTRWGPDGRAFLTACRVDAEAFRLALLSIPALAGDQIEVRLVGEGA